MIELAGVSLRYPGVDRPTLAGVDLVVPEATFCLVVGETGSGKSTLLGTLNGLVPRFTGGTLIGTVTVDGRRTSEHTVPEMADVVGYVVQDPASGFATERVEDELAFAMEQLGVAPETMRRRVEETLDVLGIVRLRERALATLSGGEMQRVAIGAALTANPKVLVLDEPTSALDPGAAEDVLATLDRLVHDLAVTVVVAEHRLERVVHFADQVVEVRADGTVAAGTPEEMMAVATVAPPVVRLGKLIDVDPVPLSVRTARRATTSLRARLTIPKPPTAPDSAPVGIHVAGLTVVHGDVPAVSNVSFDAKSGSVTAVMGRNGAGKSSLLWAIQGSQKRRSGSVDIGGADPADLAPSDARTLVALVPHNPADLLYAESVRAECARADEESGVDGGACQRLLDAIVPGIDPHRHPRDLSEGQRLGLALAIQLVAEPAAILLDEPTRGLDYASKERLGATVRRLADARRTVVVATHDVEFVAESTDRVIVIADGQIVADGPTAEVVASSPAYAPQVAKIMAPHPLLTVSDVAAAIGPS